MGAVRGGREGCFYLKGRMSTPHPHPLVPQTLPPGRPGSACPPPHPPSQFHRNPRAEAHGAARGRRAGSRVPRQRGGAEGWGPLPGAPGAAAAAPSPGPGTSSGAADPPPSPPPPPAAGRACGSGFPFFAARASGATPRRRRRRRPLTILQMEAMFRTVISLKVAAIPHRHLYKVKTGLSMVERLQGGRAAGGGRREAAWGPAFSLAGRGGREGGGGGGGRGRGGRRESGGRGLAERGSLGRGRRRRRRGRKGGPSAACCPRRAPPPCARLGLGPAALFRPRPGSVLGLFLFRCISCFTIFGLKCGGRPARLRPPHRAGPPADPDATAAAASSGPLAPWGPRGQRWAPPRGRSAPPPVGRLGLGLGLGAGVGVGGAPRPGHRRRGGGRRGPGALFCLHFLSPASRPPVTLGPCVLSGRERRGVGVTKADVSFFPGAAARWHRRGPRSKRGQDLGASESPGQRGPAAGCRAPGGESHLGLGGGQRRAQAGADSSRYKGQVSVQGKGLSKGQCGSKKKENQTNAP